MTDTTTVVAVPTESRSIVDWPAVLGGALIASALWLVLFAFGSAAGIMAVSPYSWSNPSATTLTIVGVAWFAIIMIGSYMVGGYFAGRFRRPLGDATVAEREQREQRDGAQGLVVWALSLLIGVAVTATLTMAAARGAASAVGGAASVAAQAVPQDRVSGIIDSMMRPPAGEGGAAARVENPRAEIARVLSTQALTRGEIRNEDRDYVARVVAAEAKIPPEEARRRVDASIEQAKQAADAARKIAAAIAFLVGATSILSAGAAYWAATAGGRQRDEALNQV